jgi:rsbT co-antagonist protein RsbR
MASRLPEILARDHRQILADWLALLAASPDPRVPAAEAQAQCDAVLSKLAQGTADGNISNLDAPSFAPLRDVLEDLASTRAQQGFAPSEAAAWLFSLKPPLFARLGALPGADAGAMAQETLAVTRLVDTAGLLLVEAFQRAREEVIIRQQTEIAELSTPVVKLWQGILALPLIGTLDSARTQVVMENLLDSIVRYEADIAIIDITGVPTVDTLVAQHLLKTVAAARLMGADCIISGIRPQIAQTMVHLGVELNVVSKANLADAFALALRRLGKTVVSVKRPASPDAA